MKSRLVLLLAAPLLAIAAEEVPPHTGELLIQKKGEDRILLHRPVGRETAEALRARLLKTGKYNFVAYNTIELLDPEEGEEGPNTIQWHHKNISTNRAWELSAPQHPVLVAVCDSGVQVDHEDLAGQVLPGWSLIENAEDNTTTTSHGTFVGGLIAAQVNDLGGTGVVPHAKILPLRISNDKGSTTMKRITDCIRMATDKGARVVNVSFTGIEHPAVAAAAQYAFEKGTLLVYAAGNRGAYKDLEAFPDSPYFLAVGATNREDKRWWYWKDLFKFGGSNYGEFIDLMAPGHELTSTTVYDPALPEQARYRSGSGTSYSAPLVTAAAALVISINPELSAAQVTHILTKSADSMRNEQHFGAGRLNVYEAVKLALESR